MSIAAAKKVCAPSVLIEPPTELQVSTGRSSKLTGGLTGSSAQRSSYTPDASLASGCAVTGLRYQLLLPSGLSGVSWIWTSGGSRSSGAGACGNGEKSV